jgi:hypothetical protein
LWLLIAQSVADSRKALCEHGSSGVIEIRKLEKKFSGLEILHVV